jgi:sugar phosphate isomerase/epimerase
MGDGCIDIRRLRSLVESLGFQGYHEVEVFSEEYWAMDQSAYVDLILERYRSAS